MRSHKKFRPVSRTDDIQIPGRHRNRGLSPNKNEKTAGFNACGLLLSSRVEYAPPKLRTAPPLSRSCTPLTDFYQNYGSLAKQKEGFEQGGSRLVCGRKQSGGLFLPTWSRSEATRRCTGVRRKNPLLSAKTKSRSQGLLFALAKINKGDSNKVGRLCR